MRESRFNVKNKFFSGERVQSIAIVSFKDKPMMHTADLHEKKIFFDYLDLISTSKKISVILFLGPPVKMQREEYSDFYKKLSNLIVPRFGMDVELVERFHNGINQFVLKMAECDKIVISADSGEAPLIYLGVSLVYDYRIIADDTVYSNPNIELKVIPNGGITYFLANMIGRKKAFDILLSDKDITAEEALELGMVDKVVPVPDLGETALALARFYAGKPSTYLSGIKKLLNYNMYHLEKALDYEKEIIRMGCRDDFRSRKAI